MKNLLQHRKSTKKHKPTFVRQETSKQKKLQNKVRWRFPRGLHSKIRRAFKGHVRLPDPGYSSPRAVRGLTSEGYKQIVIHSVKEMTNLKEPFFIASDVGTKNRIAILKKAQEMKLLVLNFKDSSAFIKNVEEKMKKAKESKKLSKEKKAKSKEEAIKKAEEAEKKAKKEKEETPEEKQKREKEENKKVLEQR